MIFMMAKNKKMKKKPAQSVSDSKIEVKIEGKKSPKQKGFSAAATAVTVLIIIAVFYVLTSTTEIKIVEMENYTIIETYAEEVPYTITEEYQERVPYGLPYCGKTGMNFTATEPKVSFAGSGTVVCSFNLTNLEIKGGTWEYQAYIPGNVGNRYDKHNVGPNETATFNFYFDSSVTSPFSCVVSPVSLPSIERCYWPEETFYKYVTKTRNVTKYKNVTMEKPVTVLSETASVKTVNRFFGYEMPSLGW